MLWRHSSKKPTRDLNYRRRGSRYDIPASLSPLRVSQVVLMWYVYSMVITNMYMSVLIKQMTHTSYVGSVESLEDVISQNLVPLIFEKSSSIPLWTNSVDPTLR